MNKFKFGSSDAIVINDLSIKNKIIHYLFNTVNLSKFRYVMLENIQHLETLKKNPNFVSPNFKGYNYILLFTKINNSSYCVAIDKKRMSYHKDKINVKQINMYKLKIMTKPSLFNGSIFDCKLIRSKKYIMLIKDCYKIMNNDLLHMKMDDKMNYLNSIIENQITDCSYFDFKINKLYNYDNLETLVNEVIPKCKLEIQGLIFYPKFSGITTIFINKKNNTSRNNVVFECKDEVYDILKNLAKVLSERTYSYEKEGNTKNLELKKTNTVDVYNVCEIENGERIGIAHIPNLKISRYCQDTFKDCNNAIFKCVYNNDYNKWIPLSTCNN